MFVLLRRGLKRKEPGRSFRLKPFWGKGFLNYCRPTNYRILYPILLETLWTRATMGVYFLHTHLLVPASGQAVVTGCVPSPPRFLSSFFIAHRAQQSHCSSISHRVLLTHALALSAGQFVRKKKSPRMYTSMHSGGFELTKLTYTRLEDNLIRHRGDWAGI